jgi:hypothetical protein
LSGVWLRVTYRVRADQIAEFQRLLFGEVLPLAGQLGMTRPTVWRTRVGSVGEFLELWPFDSLQDYDSRFRGLLEHPRFQELLRKTGPMVQDESFALVELVGDP